MQRYELKNGEMVEELRGGWCWVEDVEDELDEIRIQAKENLEKLEKVIDNAKG